MNKNISYKRNGLNIVIIVHDENWKKLDTFKYSESNQKIKAQIIGTLKDKYNISFKPTINRDIDWLKGDFY